MDNGKFLLAGLSRTVLRNFDEDQLVYFQNVELLSEVLTSKQLEPFLDNQDNFFIGSFLAWQKAPLSKDALENFISKMTGLKDLHRDGVISTAEHFYLCTCLMKNLNYNLEQEIAKMMDQRIQEKPRADVLKYIEEEEQKREMSDIIEVIRKEKEEQQNKDLVCNICIMELTTEKYLPLDTCGHIFHFDCIQKHIYESIKVREIPVKCPEADCRKPLRNEDVREIIDGFSYGKYVDYTLKSFIDRNLDEYSWCPTPGCEYAFIMTIDTQDFKCEMCKKRYCFRCKVEFHHGQTCKEYQITHTYDNNDAKFEEYVKKNQNKQCATCKFWVSKNQGCNHMTCRCGYQFCYVCGKEWKTCSH
eukprot:TRINITY_DN5888_c0_g1_i2.p1 TRINITY_DN5888_c0_g1~~TRINITY_DN5888_c0_g1_i2.p1  ORF type:complete len:359 (+),score=31.80 TRINITY_DN5888_c0_g1_i2:85-1161(+)